MRNKQSEGVGESMKRRSEKPEFKKGAGKIHDKVSKGDKKVHN